jgi:phosphoglycerate dehydrogenase-like enzyme
MGHDAFHATFGPAERARIDALATVVAPPQTPESALALPAEILSSVDCLITGWGGPVLDAAWLARLPRLASVFHAAGSVSRIMTVEAWQRNLVVTTASEANALAVAEYTGAMIVLCLKRVWRLALELRACGAAPSRATIGGCVDAVVGVVSLGVIGRLVAAQLARLDVTRLAHDPHVSPRLARTLGITLVSLEELFQASDVVTIHAPHLPATERLITGAHLSSMQEGAALINTASGAVVREDELIEVAGRRPDLQFVLDVAWRMPPDPDSPLYRLPNVLLTPHIAGSRGRECRRMGRAIVSELERHVGGRPLRCRITLDTVAHTAHRPVAV